MAGGHCLRSDGSGVLRFHPGSEPQLILSAPRAPAPCPRDDIITALRGKLKEPDVARAVRQASS